MTAVWRIAAMMVLAGAAFAPAGARAQEASNESVPADPVGPDELQDFNLPGTVIRPAEPQPERTPPPRTPPSPTTTPPSSTQAPAARASRPTPERVRPPIPAPQSPAERPRLAPRDERPAIARTTPLNVALPPISDLPAGPGSQPGALPDTSSGEGGSGAPWPWVALSALIVAGAGAYWWRRRTAFAGAWAGEEEFAAGASGPAPVPPAPEPVTARDAVAPVGPAAQPPLPEVFPAGIVSTRMRPRIELAFRPLGCAVDDDNCTIEFELGLFNSGTKAARAILVEARFFNAGNDQDEAIAQFFAEPVGAGGRATELAPLKRMVIRNKVVTPRNHIREFEVEGRRFFVPLVAFNALYRWGDHDGQTSAGYLLGRKTPGDKMAPLRLDLGARHYRDLAIQPLPLSLQT